MLESYEKLHPNIFVYLIVAVTLDWNMSKNEDAKTVGWNTANWRQKPWIGHSREGLFEDRTMNIANNKSWNMFLSIKQISNNYKLQCQL